MLSVAQSTSFLTEALLCSKRAPAWWVCHPSTSQPSAASHHFAGSVDRPALRRLWRALCPTSILTFGEMCSWVSWHSVSMGLPINPEGVWAELRDMLGEDIDQVSGASMWQEPGTSCVTRCMCAELQGWVSDLL